ncbi:flippase-like domain-containing protein [bacterium]|nr:flippase-like domain-containing protein [bacterium]
MNSEKLGKQGSSLGKYFKIAIGIVISLVFVGLALHNIDFGKLLNTFVNINLFWVALAGILIFVTYFLRVLIWRQLLHQYPTNMWNLFRIMTLGYFANNLLPLRLGEVVRIWLLGKKENLPAGISVATVVIERGVDLFSLLFYFVLMMFFIPFEGWLKLSGLILAGFGLVFALVLVLNHRFGGHLIEWIEKPLERLPGGVGVWIHKQFGKFLGGLKLLDSFPQLMRVLVLGLIIWLTWITVVYFCFLALGLNLSFLAAIFLIVVLNFGLMIPSSPGGLGVFEFMVILALKPFGVEKEVALGVGFTFHMLQYILTFIVGWIFAVQMNVSMLKVSRESTQREGMQ